MPCFDLDGEPLENYRARETPPDDLDQFWAETLRGARDASRDPTVRRVDNGLRLVETFDVTFHGFGGDPVRAWYHRPSAEATDLPTVVRFHGYGGGRGLAHQIDHWVMAGYACLEVDARGQGAAASAGDTDDPHGSGPSMPGFLTRGVLEPATYYYRRVFTDAVMAVECARGMAGVDPDKVAVTGVSQGGGISLAVAALDNQVRAVMADVPFLCDFRRGASVALQPPYTELTALLANRPDLADRVWATLRYFDVALLVSRATAPAMYSVALMDEVCPPSTVYASYNSYGGPKEIRTYAFNGHEGGHAHHEREQLQWLGDLLGEEPVGRPVEPRRPHGPTPGA